MSVTVGSETLYTGDLIGLIDNFSGKYIKRQDIHGKWGNAQKNYSIAGTKASDINIPDEKTFASYTVFVNPNKSLSFMGDNERFVQVGNCYDETRYYLYQPDEATNTRPPTRRFILSSAGDNDNKVFIKSVYNNKYLKTASADLEYTGPMKDDTCLESPGLGIYSIIRFGSSPHFPSVVEEIKYDLSKAIVTKTSDTVAQQSFQNKTDKIVSYNLESTKTYNEEKSFTFGHSFVFGDAQPTKISVPVVSETGVISLSSNEISFSFSSSSTSSSESLSLCPLQVEVPPKSVVNASYVLVLGKCSVPFVSTIIRTDDSGDAHKFQVAGIYEGVNFVKSEIKLG